MNQQIQVARLQSLLERVQTRAKQERQRPLRAAAPVAAKPAPRTEDMAVSRSTALLPPVVMALTADSTETDETRPFAKLTAAQLAAAPPQPASTPVPPRVSEPVPATVQHTTARPPAPEMVLEPLEPKPIESAAPAEEPHAPMAEQPEPEPPASSRRPAQVREPEPEELALEAEVPVEKHDTEPPRSGPQLLEGPAAAAIATSTEFEVDFDGGRLDREAAEAPAVPSGAQLGQMLELDELSEGPTGGIELAPPPVAEAPPPAMAESEMEASLPSALRPGVHTPEIAPVARAPEVPAPAAESVFGAEPRTTDWDAPAVSEGSGVVDTSRTPAAEARAPSPEPAATPAAPEPLVAAKAEGEPSIKELLEAATAKEPSLQPAPASVTLRAANVAEPIALDVVPVVVQPGQVAAANVASFVGAVKWFSPSAFVEALDATLELGEE